MRVKFSTKQINAIAKAFDQITSAIVNFYFLTDHYDDVKKIMPQTAPPYQTAVDKLTSYISQLLEHIETSIFTSEEDLKNLFSKIIGQLASFKAIKQQSFISDLQAAFMIDMLIDGLKNLAEPGKIRRLELSTAALERMPEHIEVAAHWKIRFLDALKTVNEVVSATGFFIKLTALQADQVKSRKKIKKDEEYNRREEIQRPSARTKRLLDWMQSQSTEKPITELSDSDYVPTDTENSGTLSSCLQSNHSWASFFAAFPVERHENNLTLGLSDEARRPGTTIKT